MRYTDVPPWPVYSLQSHQEVSRLIADGTVYDYRGEGPVLELEREFAALHPGSFALTFNSGTSALFAAFAALGIGAGDEVIVPNLTFLASMTPLMWLGATPVLADSAFDDPSIDVRSVAAVTTARTKAVVATHLFGNPVDSPALQEHCRRHGLLLVEDCSHAHASFIDEQHVGMHGDAAIYSIGAAKLVSGGHGGVLITRDPDVHDVALLTGHFKPRTRHDLLRSRLSPFAELALGGNLRLSPLAAALALDHLRSLDTLSEQRDANVAVLDGGLGDLLRPVRTTGRRRNGTHFDMVYSLPEGTTKAQRDGLSRKLRSAGLEVLAPSTRPLNRVLQASAGDLSSASPHRRAHPLLEQARAAPDDSALPHSTSQHDRMLSFPAGRLYSRDLSAAHHLVGVSRPVVEAFLHEARIAP